ncbi:transcriptional regulator TbsP domain-containing protein [Halobaculum sp. P14]|uniref:transcriptional regulator TbsP domain-containing protein n=1 Tax=Halobaculum sp. P14 TaxID=3421638 RepID=UPI003EBBDC77
MTGARTGPLSDVLRRPLRDASDTALLASASPLVLREAVLALAALDDPTPTRLLGTGDALDALVDDFAAATRAADLRANDGLELRRVDDATLPSVVVADETVTTVAALPGGEDVALESDDGGAVAAARDALEATARDTDPYEFSAPAYAAMLDRLGRDVDEGARADAEAVLDADVRIRRSAGDLDEVDLFILLAARNDAQLYTLSGWAEAVGIASRATISVRKRRLEDSGLVATEKVPTDVGRPRQQLTLGDDDLRDATPTDVVRTARGVLGRPDP